VFCEQNNTFRLLSQFHGSLGQVSGIEEFSEPELKREPHARELYIGRSQFGCGKIKHRRALRLKIEYRENRVGARNFSV
jgi:hypothetical protein